MTYKVREISQKKQGPNEDKYHTVRLHLFISRFKTVKRQEKKKKEREYGRRREIQISPMSFTMLFLKI